MKRLNITGEILDEFMNKIRQKLSEKIVPDKIIEEVNPDIPLKDEDKVHVYFDVSAHKKMLALIKECEKEIGWHGTAFRDPENPKIFHIKDIMIFPQTVTGSTVTPDGEQYNNWLQDMMMHDEEKFNHMRFHGHSHVNMGVSPSGVDTNFQKDILINCTDFYIFGIFNKRGDWWLSIYDVESNAIYGTKDIEYHYYINEEEDWAKKEIKEKVVTAVAQAPVYKDAYGRTAYNYGGTYPGTTYYGGYEKASGKTSEKDTKGKKGSKKSGKDKNQDEMEDYSCWDEYIARAYSGFRY